MIRTALIGAGNCAHSLVQAVEMDRRGLLQAGVLNPVLGGYRTQDITVVAAFDVLSTKVGRELAEALEAEPNCTSRYVDLRPIGIQVCPGPLLDGMSRNVALGDAPQIHPATGAADFAGVEQTLRNAGAEVAVIYLPVGSNRAASGYAAAAVGAGCAVVNCTPAPLANNPEVVNLFDRHRLPLLGDDIKSQIGSTAIHQVLLDLLRQQGVELTSTYQLNIGGNSDFKNMREPGRGAHKKRTKEVSLRLRADPGVPLSVGPSDYVPHLRDHKVGFLHLEGEGLMGMRFSIDVQLKVEDSPNSAGVVIDAVRAARLARDCERSGVIHEVCSFLFKAPVCPKADAKAAFDAFTASVAHATGPLDIEVVALHGHATTSC